MKTMEGCYHNMEKCDLPPTCHTLAYGILLDITDQILINPQGGVSPCLGPLVMM
jgi:hypothetical protein